MHLLLNNTEHSFSVHIFLIASKRIIYCCNGFLKKCFFLVRLLQVQKQFLRRIKLLPKGQHEIPSEPRAYPQTNSGWQEISNQGSPGSSAQGSATSTGRRGLGLNESLENSVQRRISPQRSLINSASAKGLILKGH